jgi:AraC family transcriptional regulator
MIQNPSLFHIPPRTRFRGHEHDGVHVCIVAAGGFVERSRHGWVDAGPGTVRISGAARHDIDFAPAGARCVLLQPMGLDLPPLPGPRFLPPDPWLVRLIGAVEASIPREGDAARGESGAMDELLAQILRRLGGRAEPPPHWLRRLRERLDDDQVPSVATLAAEFGVHRAHLARAFRDHYGTSVTAHLVRRRIERARRMLVTSGMPLAEVAITAGFADQSHMTRAVRTAYGVTPGALRRGAQPPFKTTTRTPR